jgi:hypothetical protein
VPGAAEWSRRWHHHLKAAAAIISSLPGDRVGSAVISKDGTLFTGNAASLVAALRADGVIYHPGRIRGAMPRILDPGGAG